MNAETVKRLADEYAEVLARDVILRNQSRVDKARATLHAAIDELAAHTQELRNIADAKRFDREYFDDDTSFADWVQSRARHALGNQPAAPLEVPQAEPCGWIATNYSHESSFEGVYESHNATQPRRGWAPVYSQEQMEAERERAERAEAALKNVGSRLDQLRVSAINNDWETFDSDLATARAIVDKGEYAVGKLPKDPYAATRRAIVCAAASLADPGGAK